MKSIIKLLLILLVIGIGIKLAIVLLGFIWSILTNGYFWGFIIVISILFLVSKYRDDQKSSVVQVEETLKIEKRFLDFLKTKSVSDLKGIIINNLNELEKETNKKCAFQESTLWISTNILYKEYVTSENSKLAKDFYEMVIIPNYKQEELGIKINRKEYIASILSKYNIPYLQYQLGYNLLKELSWNNFIEFHTENKEGSATKQVSTEVFDSKNKSINLDSLNEIAPTHEQDSKAQMSLSKNDQLFSYVNTKEPALREYHIVGGEFDSIKYHPQNDIFTVHFEINIVAKYDSELESDSNFNPDDYWEDGSLAFMIHKRDEIKIGWSLPMDILNKNELEQEIFSYLDVYRIVGDVECLVKQSTIIQTINSIKNDGLQIEEEGLRIINYGNLEVYHINFIVNNDLNIRWQARFTKGHSNNLTIFIEDSVVSLLEWSKIEGIFSEEEIHSFFYNKSQYSDTLREALKYSG